MRRSDAIIKGRGELASGPRKYNAERISAKSRRFVRSELKFDL